jgi:hypothetical protein
MTTQTKRTVFTVANDASGNETIKQLRKEVKAHNLVERSKEVLDPTYIATFKRVDLYGRLGKNNPNSSKYKKGGPRSSFFGATPRVLLTDAVKIAVYVNYTQRFQWGSWKGFKVVNQ